MAATSNGSTQHLAVSGVVGVNVPGVAGVGRAEERSSVDAVVVGRVADNLVLATGGKVVLAVDLTLATALGVGAGPDINVELAVLVVRGYIISVSSCLGVVVVANAFCNLLHCSQSSS